MITKGNLAGFCRTLLLAASVTALSVSMAHAQDLNGLNDQILQNPQDAELNFRYARAAEEQGELRLALAAYERVLINEPDNEAARRGYERVRRALEPPFTTVRAEFGARWDSNPLNSGIADEEAYSVFARATLTDERPIGSSRWRSIANFEGELTPDFEQLDYAFLGVQTGPLFYVAPHLAAIPSIGGGVATLDGSYYFNDINLGVTLEGKRDGVSYWTRVRGGWRSYSEDSTAEEGAYGEVIAGVAIPRIAAESGTLVLIPWARWSDIEGSAFSFFTGEITPGRFTEFGLDAAYKYQVNDQVILSGGALVRERYYAQTLISGSDRRDTYVAPEASVTLQNMLPCECGIRVSYQHRFNDSNDPASDFEAQRLSVSLLTQF